MFDSLDEQMKNNDARRTTPGQRMAKMAVIAVTSVVLFGGLYAALQLLS